MTVKLSRKSEFFKYQQLSVGDNYSKKEALILAQVSPPQNSREITGITGFNNCVVLFVTLNKESKKAAHQYNDIFLLDGEKFHWESQAKNTETTPNIVDIITGKHVVLFVRKEEKIAGKTQPFVFIGSLEYLEHQSEKPVQILYKVLDFKATSNQHLQALYLWGQGKIIEFEILPELPNLIKKVKQSGQGYISDSKKKKAIELYAMRMASEHYQKAGYAVTDTSNNCPYDLECFKENKLRRVEVKGTTSNGKSVYVTSGEVVDANSNECETDLFIVSNIHIDGKDENDNYIISGGEVELIKNWKPEQEHLEAKMYKYTVSSK